MNYADPVRWMPTTSSSDSNRGLLAFPVTHFDEDDSLDPSSFQDHVEWMSERSVSVLFPAGGAGEFHALSLAEIGDVIEAAGEAPGGIPIVSGCGYGTSIAIEIARRAEKAGVDGLLLMPHDPVGAPQPGYAVSLVKAGDDIVGYHPGGVRPPLVDPDEDDRVQLSALIEIANGLVAPSSMCTNR